MRLNALDYRSVQASLDAARDGDRVYLPRRRRPYLVPPTGWVIRSSITLYGDGSTTRGTTIVATPGAERANAELFVVKPPPGPEGMAVVIADLRILTPTGELPATLGIHVHSEASSRPASLHLEGVATAFKRRRRSKAAEHEAATESGC